MTTQANPAKLEELMLHVGRQCVTHQLFGLIKLNKILFFSDMMAFTNLGTTITGAEYEKREFGPVPRGIMDIIARMEERKIAVLYERTMPDGTVQKRLTPLREPSLDLFSAQEIAIVDQMIAWMRPFNAHEISELSHESAGWEAARMGETIPNGASLVPRHPLPLTSEDLAYAQKLADNLAQSV